MLFKTLRPIPRLKVRIINVIGLPSPYLVQLEENTWPNIAIAVSISFIFNVGKLRARAKLS